jgi:membrane-anchored glycerophosphoryl diester phosphodiesterase (GDPDase)
MRSDKHFSQTSLFFFLFFYFLFLIPFVHGILESSHESIGFVEELFTF